MDTRLLTDPTELGTILSLWAHPDDETYLAGGVMAAARANGQRVVCVSASAGEHGTDDPATWPPQRLGAIRRWEAAAAMAVLGVTEHRVLGMTDGGLAADDVAAIDEVSRLIDEVQPDTILTFGADGMTFHSDHIAVHHWANEAWCATGREARLLHATYSREFLIGHRDELEGWDMYMIDARPLGVPRDELGVHMTLDGAALDRKLTALRAMATQTRGVIDAVGSETYATHVREEWFVDASRVLVCA